MSLMMEELLSVPESLEKVLATNLATARSVATLVKERNIEFITTVARGTSNNASSFFKYICEMKSGIMVSKFNHSVTTIKESKTNLAKSLCIGISQSGMSTDTINVMQMAKEAGALTLAITNNETSPLAKMCDFHIYLNCGEEKSVAATKTFTLQIANLYMLAALLSDNVLPDFKRIAEDLRSFTKDTSKLEELAKSTTDIDNMVILSRGETLGIAEEMSLKLTETCYKFSKPFSVAEFNHGPFAIIDKGRTVIMLAPSGDFSQEYILMAKRLNDLGANIIAFTDIEEIIKLSKHSFIMIGNKYSEAYLYILAMQSYVAYLSVALGNDPDRPRGLRKVTITV